VILKISHKLVRIEFLSFIWYQSRFFRKFCTDSREFENFFTNFYWVLSANICIFSVLEHKLIDTFVCLCYSLDYEKNRQTEKIYEKKFRRQQSSRNVQEGFSDGRVFRRAEQSLFVQGHIKMISFFFLSVTSHCVSSLHI